MENILLDRPALMRDRIAMYGANAVLSEVTKAVIAALGKADRTEVFGTREEALA